MFKNMYYWLKTVRDIANNCFFLLSLYFISALEHFWNGWASARRDIVLIVCGSATSWMMDKLINNHGGLYGRLTHRLLLQPFSLGESEAFLKTKGMMLSRYEMAELYMTLRSSSGWV